MDSGTNSEDRRRRWDDSRRHLREAGSALKAGRLAEAFALFTRAHDLGDDHVLCHMRGHLGRARVEMRKGDVRDAAVDAFFALVAIVVSPARRLRGARGRGFPGQAYCRVPEITLQRDAERIASRRSLDSRNARSG